MHVHAYDHPFNYLCEILSLELRVEVITTFSFLRLWIFFVWLAVPSKPSSQPIWLKV